MFNENLRAAREAAGLSQKELAAKLYVSQQALAKWELGTSSPNPETTAEISKILNISADKLLGTENNAIDIDDFAYALYNETKELSDDQKSMVLSMAQSFKERLKKDGKM